MPRQGDVEIGDEVRAATPLTLVEDPFTAFATAQRPGLVRLAYVITGDAHLAEDLVQSTLTKTYRFWDRVSAANSPTAYVRQILVREHLSWRRRLSSREVVHPQPTDLVASTAVDDPQVGELDAAWRLLATLPPKQRTILALRYFDDLSDEDIATTMGVSAVTVRTNASRGLATLRQRLDEQGHDL